MSMASKMETYENLWLLSTVMLCDNMWNGELTIHSYPSKEAAIADACESLGPSDSQECREALSTDGGKYTTKLINDTYTETTISQVKSNKGIVLSHCG